MAKVTAGERKPKKRSKKRAKTKRVVGAAATKRAAKQKKEQEAAQLASRPETTLPATWSEATGDQRKALWAGVSRLVGEGGLRSVIKAQVRVLGIRNIGVPTANYWGGGLGVAEFEKVTDLACDFVLRDAFLDRSWPVVWYLASVRPVKAQMYAYFFLGVVAAVQAVALGQTLGKIPEGETAVVIASDTVVIESDATALMPDEPEKEVA